MSRRSDRARMASLVAMLSPVQLAKLSAETHRRALEALMDGVPHGAEADARAIGRRASELVGAERTRYEELHDAAAAARMVASPAAATVAGLLASQAIAVEAVAGWELVAHLAPLLADVLAAYRQALALGVLMAQQDATLRADLATEGLSVDGLADKLNALAASLAPLAEAARGRLAAARTFDTEVSKQLRALAETTIAKLDELVAPFGDVDPVPRPWRELLELGRAAVAAADAAAVARGGERPS